jgi:N-acetylmuramoyl-L-alanine amidase
MLINNKFASPNFSKRSKLIEYAILHFTEMPFEGSLARLCDKAYEVSAHYLIKEDGEMFQLVDDKNVAWHAGVSSWCGQDKLNQNSIGIELDNLGDREFSKVQMNSCIELCKILAKKYDILAENFIGHSDVAPARKIDPGIFIDWKS